MLNLASDLCLLHESLNKSRAAPQPQRLKIVDLADNVVARLLVNGEVDLGRGAASDREVCDAVLVVKLLNGLLARIDRVLQTR